MRQFLESNLSICIPPIKKFCEDELGLSELVVSIKDYSLSITKENPSQDWLRFQSFLALIKETLDFCGPVKDCRFILNMYEGVYEDREQRFCYTAKPNSGHILIPDAHCFITSQRISEVERLDTPFSEKKAGAIFCGSDTGARRKDSWTMRSLLSATYKNSSLIKSKLTYLDADTSKRLAGKIEVSKIYSPPISIQEQLQYQVILNVNGNSTSWERLLWAMASNSLCVFIKPFDGEEMYSWYYPLLEASGVCPLIEYDRLETFMESNDFSSDFWRQKNKDQQTFAKFVSAPETRAKFMKMILDKYADES